MVPRPNLGGMLRGMGFMKSGHWSGWDGMCPLEYMEQKYVISGKCFAADAECLLPNYMRREGDNCV